MPAHPNEDRRSKYRIALEGEATLQAAEGFFAEGADQESRAIPADVSGIDQEARTNSGRARRTNWSGESDGERLSNGSRHSRNGSSAEKSIFPKIASIDILPRTAGTRRRLLWEGEPGERRTLTYQQLHREVCRFANVLKRNKIGKGDRVIIYMPTTPEVAIAMLACARIGAVHSVVFGGFSADSIRDRIADSGAIALITADGSYRRGGIVPLKKNVDDALRGGTSVRRVIVFQRAHNEIHMEEGRDVWWHRELEYVDDDCPPTPVDSEHPLYILYTSGSTGKPKGILHTTGGYLVGIYSTTKYVFDIREEDIYWCTADVGWVTGHSYVVYGPLANGATTFMYEGAPNWPEPDRFWRIIAQNRINILYTAPTAIRAFIRWGDQWVKKHDLSSLRLLGTVGEPINPEAWMWYHKTIGGGRCPVVDTWWQTETGAIMITPLPGAIPTKPGSATLPFFGVDAAVVDTDGKEVGANVGGKLIIRRPWPSMLRTIYGDKERYKEQYWSEYPGNYLTGDGARRDEDGLFLDRRSHRRRAERCGTSAWNI